MKSKTLSFTVPELLRLELSAIPETGYYDSTSEFLRDAMRTLLSARKDLRIAIALKLYEKNKVSLGKAVEIASVGYDEMKKLLAEKGVKRSSGAGVVSEAEKELKSFKKLKVHGRY